MMLNSTSRQSEPATKLQREKRHAHLAAEAFSANGGARPWRKWKEQSLGDLVGMADQSNRVVILQASITTDFDVTYRIKQPMPCTPVDGRLVVRDTADYHLHFEEDWTYEMPPSWLPLSLFHPRDPFHPNCNMRPALWGSICLGDLIGTLVCASPKEIALAGYFATTLHSLTLDEEDPHGILNVAASRYFKQHPEYLPLTRAGLFEDWDGWKGAINK